MRPIEIRHDVGPGDLGRLIALHGTAYERETGHFGLNFEAFVARTVAEFVIDNQARGRIFLAERGAELVGCAAMVLRDSGLGQLRWVLCAPSARGLGLGGRLVSMAIEFAKAQGCRGVFLETTGGLDISLSLYQKLGFRETGRRKAALWSGEDEVISMTLALA